MNLLAFIKNKCSNFNNSTQKCMITEEPCQVLVKLGRCLYFERVLIPLQNQSSSKNNIGALNNIRKVIERYLERRGLNEGSIACGNISSIMHKSPSGSVCSVCGREVKNIDPDVVACVCSRCILKSVDMLPLKQPVKKNKEEKVETKTRSCPDCGESMTKRKRYCEKCRIKRAKENSKKWRKERMQNSLDDEHS